MERNVKETWGDFLNPDVMRPCLVSAAIYIAAFESLKDSIIGQIRSFFWTGFDGKQDIIAPRYQTDVLSRNRSPLHASLEWLQERGIIDEADVAAFERVKACRNTLAHELLQQLCSGKLPSDFEKCFQEMVALLHKIELWWITEVEIPTNPDFDDQEIDVDGIIPGRVMVLQLLCDIALGSDERSRFYYEEFRKRTSPDPD